MSILKAQNRRIKSTVVRPYREANGDSRRVAVGAAIFSDRTWKQLARSLSISDREFEMVHGVFDDLSEQAIAERCGMSPHTVHTHFKRLYQKLGVTSRTQLILRLFQEYLATSQGTA